MSDRNLTPTQHRLLDKIATEDPEATVMGWTDGPNGTGPLVLRSNLDYVVANVTGRTKAAA